MMKSETQASISLLALLVGIRVTIFGFVLVYSHPVDIWQFSEYLALILLIAAVPMFILLSQERFQ